MGWPHKRWIDTLKERLKKRGLDFGQARRMVHDREKWGVSRSRQHSRHYITAENKAVLKIRQQAIGVNGGGL